jgi:hypothetical protein
MRLSMRMRFGADRVRDVRGVIGYSAIGRFPTSADHAIRALWHARNFNTSTSDRAPHEVIHNIALFKRFPVLKLDFFNYLKSLLCFLCRLLKNAEP